MANARFKTGIRAIVKLGSMPGKTIINETYINIDKTGVIITFASFFVLANTVIAINNKEPVNASDNKANSVTEIILKLSIV